MFSEVGVINNLTFGPLTGIHFHVYYEKETSFSFFGRFTTSKKTWNNYLVRFLSRDTHVVLVSFRCVFCLFFLEGLVTVAGIVLTKDCLRHLFVRVLFRSVRRGLRNKEQRDP